MLGLPSVIRRSSESFWSAGGSALGHTQIVGNLLDRGAQVDTTVSSGMTALMAAAGEGNDDVVDLLVRRGGVEELDRVDASGNTALLHAARAGNVATMTRRRWTNARL